MIEGLTGIKRKREEYLRIQEHQTKDERSSKREMAFQSGNIGGYQTVDLYLGYSIEYNVSQIIKSSSSGSSTHLAILERIQKHC